MELPEEAISPRYPTLFGCCPGSCGRVYVLPSAKGGRGHLATLPAHWPVIRSSAELLCIDYLTDSERR
jgi:hypothetical protein